MRRDAFGFFWNDTPAETRSGKKVAVGPRPLPPIPETGWQPRDFPNLTAAKLIGLDTETKDLELEEKGPGVRRDGHIVGISVATEDNHAWYFPMRHELGINLSPDAVLLWAKDNLTRPNQPKIGTNLLYDLDFLAQEGVNVTGPFYDIQVAEALIDENSPKFSLEYLSHHYLKKGKVTEQVEDWIWRAYGNRTYRAELWRTPPELVGPYAEGDAINPIQIFRQQLRMLRAENLEQLFDIESALIPGLLAMRRRGIRIDPKKLQQVDDELSQNIIDESRELNSVAGFEVNVDAKEHLVKLFDGLGLPYPRTAPTSRFPNGQPSFVKEFLEHHAHPVAQRIVALRKWEKFQGTFIRGYLSKLQVNGRVHCLFNQTRNDEYGAVSGRFSSSLPNLQNIPARDEIWGPKIRSIFLPDEGEELYAPDWSQIEFRYLTHIGVGKSAEWARDMYRKDPSTDFHQWVSEITTIRRKLAKNLNFGLVYGMGENELSRQLGLPLDQAKPIFLQYHERLPFVRETYRAASDRASAHGYITTFMNRRRRFNLWEPRYSNKDEERETALPQAAAMAKWGPRVRRAYTHKALNAEIQGSAADLMKKAMMDYFASKMASVLGAPLLTVHDELVFSVPRTNEGLEAIAAVKNMMETCLKWSIPIVVDMEHGANWGETQK